MRKLFLLLAVVIFSLAACDEDPLHDMDPKADSSNLDVQSTEDDPPRDEEPPPKDEDQE